MKLDRVDGHNLAMASDGSMAIVSATKTEEETPCECISMEDAKRALGVASGDETVEVLSESVCVGGVHLDREQGHGRFPDLLQESIWSTLSDEGAVAVSVVVDIERLRNLLSILADASPAADAWGHQTMVMTVSTEDDSSIVFTSEADGELMAGALAAMEGSNVPAWNPNELNQSVAGTQKSLDAGGDVEPCG